MDEFRKKIQKRSVLLRISIATIFIINGILYIIQKDAPQLEEGASFQMGVLLGIGIIGCFSIYRYHLALKDEVKLKKLYIEEHDERKHMIKEKMSQSAIWTSVILLLLVGSVMAYVNTLIALTLIITAMMIMVIMCLFKVYYFHKY